MAGRIRPIVVMLQIEAVVDDGETLTPVQIAPIRLAPEQLAQFDLVAQLAQLQEQIDARETDPI